jgi:hypothetical protein
MVIVGARAEIFDRLELEPDLTRKKESTGSTTLYGVPVP